jgi:hypothetical protein
MRQRGPRERVAVHGEREAVQRKWFLAGSIEPVRNSFARSTTTDPDPEGADIEDPGIEVVEVEDIGASRRDEGHVGLGSRIHHTVEPGSR